MSNLFRYVHNNKDKRLRYSTAYSFTKNEDGTLTIHYGIAQCRKSDTFSREVGRSTATKRLLKAFEGKKAKGTDQSGMPKVPLYGTLTVQDAPGLSVSKVVNEEFLRQRSSVLAAHSELQLATQAFFDL